MPGQQEHVIGVGEELRGDQHPPEVAHLPPDHRVGPVLDVEVVVFHVREHRAGEPQLGLEGGPVLVAVDQLGVLVHDPVALGDDGLDRPLQRLAALHLGDVGAQEAERDVRVLQPHLVAVVEGGTGREVEPGLLGLLPGGQPLVALRVAAQSGQHLLGRGVAGEPVGDPELDRELGQLLDLIVRPEQVDLDPGHHLGDRLVRDGREQLLAAAEEVQVGGVAEVEELEVVLPQLQGQVDQPVVGGQQVERAARAAALGDDRHVLALRERRERDGFELVDECPDLRQPSRVQPVPVGEVVPGPFGEFGDPCLDLLRVGHPDGGEVHVAVQDAYVHAAGGRDHVVPGVVLRQRDQRVLHDGGVPRRDHFGGVHAVHEPERRLLVLPAVLAEHRRVRVQALPPFRPGWRRHLERAGEPVGHDVPP